MRRPFSWLTLVSLILMTLPLSVWASFDDVSEDHEHYAAISWMESREVIQGYEDGTFRPDQEVNRAEALKIILLGSDIEVNTEFDTETADDLFPDVTADDWFYPYVAKGLELGIVQGYDDGTFLPEETINLAETLKMVSVTRGVEMTEVPEAPYADVAADAWFAPYVQYAKERNYIAAHSDGYLHPDYDVNRGDLIEIMYRFAYTEERGMTSFTISLNWTEYQHDDFDYAFRAPFDWTVFSSSEGDIILWHQDTANGQVAWDRTTPNSAVVVISVDDTDTSLSSSEYFNAIADGMEAYVGKDTIITTSETADDYLALLVTYESDYEAVRDLYIQMPDDVYIAVQATYGIGLLQEQLLAQIEAIQSSVYYSLAPEEPEEPEQDPDEVTETARANIQVDGEGQNTLDLFSDLELIETDTIGVGTGPVDYYYSAWADVTLKYERSFDVILDVEDGQTTAF